MVSINRARNYLATLDNTYCLLNFKLSILYNAKAKSDCEARDNHVLFWWLTPLIKNGLCYLVKMSDFVRYIFFILLSKNYFLSVHGFLCYKFYTALYYIHYEYRNVFTL